jgi:hypothetical protein
MSALPLEFNGSFEHSELLTNFTCRECKSLISESDISQRNYVLYVSNHANEIQQVFDYEEEPVYFLHFWLKAVHHRHCYSFISPSQRTLRNHPFQQVRGTEP